MIWFFIGCLASGRSKYCIRRDNCNDDANHEITRHQLCLCNVRDSSFYDQTSNWYRLGNQPILRRHG